MTREEIVEAISNDKMMPFIQPAQLSEIVGFVIKNYKPSLPSNLDEAAEDYEAGIHFSLSVAFISGAEWMAGQGVSMQITDETELADLDSFVHKNITGGSIIQIRKK